MAQIQEQLENIPGYDIAMDKFNEVAGEKFNTMDPFEDENGKRRKLNPEVYLKKEQQAWRKIQRQAWIDDKCFLGLCGVGMDCGIGLAPVACFFIPALGPLMMYVIHARLISIAEKQFFINHQLEAKLHSNIIFDLLISLPPVIGGFLTWLNGCLTRNAGMIYKHLERLAAEKQNNERPQYVGTSEQQQHPLYQNYARSQNYNPPPQKKSIFKKATEDPIQVSSQQQSGIL